MSNYRTNSVNSLCAKLNIKPNTIYAYATRHNITAKEALNIYLDRQEEKIINKLPESILKRPLYNILTNETKTIQEWLKCKTAKRTVNRIYNKYVEYCKLYKTTDNVNDFDYIDKLFQLLLFSRYRNLDVIHFVINASYIIEETTNKSFSVLYNIYPNECNVPNAYNRHIRQNISIKECVMEHPNKNRMTYLKEEITINNVTKPAYEWCNIYNISTSLYKSRAREGISPIDCLDYTYKCTNHRYRHKFNKDLYTINGESHTINDWCNILNITSDTIFNHRKIYKCDYIDCLKYYIERYNKRHKNDVRKLIDENKINIQSL